MQTKPLTDATTAAILDATTRLVGPGGRSDLSLSEIAVAAGVSRQSVYLGFGGRAGLLAALLERAAAQSPAIARLEALTREPQLTPKRLLTVAEAWIDHLAEVYPVAALLDAVALSDPDAALATRRFAARGRGYFAVLLAQVGGEWGLRDGLAPGEAADLAWSALDHRAWRGLVVEGGWSPDAFRANRAIFMRRMVLHRQG